jgi:broad specificity phosphatase PhoE
MAIHLVRHAKAGGRPDWHQPDDLRPLTSAGLVQAATVADTLRGHDIVRIASSRYVRCVQTVQPLADALGLDVEQHAALAEEADIERTWRLLEEAAADARGDTVLCSHGNVIPAVLDRLHRRGIDLVADDATCEKGSVWTVEVTPDGRGFARAVHTLARA